MFKLTLRQTSAVPLELHGITPTAVATLSALEVARLPIGHGNRSEPLGEFFDVAPSPRTPGANLHFAGDTRNVHGIGAGMTEGFVYAENEVGRHAGAQMTGGKLILDGSAGDWLGAELRGGTIEVRGSTGNQACAAYRGSRRGMRGGFVHIHGGAGDELGLLMRRGLVLVEGPVGEFAGASMIAGSLFLLGGTGHRLGAGMKRGTILATGANAELPLPFRFACRYAPSFLTLYAAQLRAWGRDIPAIPAEFTVDCYRGDVLNGGRGEILIPVAGPR